MCVRGGGAFSPLPLCSYAYGACSSDEQIDGGWGGGGGGGGGAAAEHLTSGMLHLHDQLRTCVQLKKYACVMHPLQKKTTEHAHTHTLQSILIMFVT